MNVFKTKTNYMNLNVVRSQLAGLQQAVNMENLLEGDSYRPQRLYLQGWAEFTIRAQIQDTNVGEDPHVSCESMAQLAYLFQIPQDTLTTFVDPDVCEDFATAMRLYEGVMSILRDLDGSEPLTEQNRRILRRWAARVKTSVEALLDDPGEQARDLHSSITLAAMINDLDEPDVVKKWLDSVAGAARDLVRATV